jgi:hypothetical protein
VSCMMISRRDEAAPAQLSRVVGHLCVLSAVYCPDVFAHVAVHACTGRGCADDGRVVFIT